MPVLGWPNLVALLNCSHDLERKHFNHRTSAMEENIFCSNVPAFCALPKFLLWLTGLPHWLAQHPRKLPRNQEDAPKRALFFNLLSLHYFKMLMKTGRMRGFPQ